MIKTPGHVVVRGVAEGGRNLQFTWGISRMIMKKPLSKGECFLDNEVAVGDKDTRACCCEGSS